MAMDEEHSEPELVEIFIEEAKEEIEKIRQNLPRWIDQPEDGDVLIGVRRSFHTLKGSGRVIGAQLLGEFAWSVENLLNRVINKTLAPNPGMLEFVVDAAKVLPSLVEQLETGIPPSADVEAMIARAEAFVEGRADEDIAILETDGAGDASTTDAVAAESAMDPVLQKIFIKEVREHLTIVRGFVDEAAVASPPISVTE